MTAADVTERINEHLHIPGIEVVVLTASNDETYNSKKFAKILAASISIMEDEIRDIAVSISGNQATIRSTGLSDKLVCLTLYGRH